MNSKSERTKKRQMNRRKLRRRAIVLACEVGISGFKASRCYLSRFCQRKGITCRAITHTAQIDMRTKTEVQDAVLSFFAQLSLSIIYYDKSCILNMDWTRHQCTLTWFKNGRLLNLAIRQSTLTHRLTIRCALIETALIGDTKKTMVLMLMNSAPSPTSAYYSRATQTASATERRKSKLRKLATLKKKKKQEQKRVAMTRSITTTTIGLTGCVSIAR